MPMAILGMSKKLRISNGSWQLFMLNGMQLNK